MMNGFRRTFMSSLNKKKDVKDVDADDSPAHCLRLKQQTCSSFNGLFSNPSTPLSLTRPDSMVSSSPLPCAASPSPPSSSSSPNLHCNITSGDVTPTSNKTPRRSPLSLLRFSSSPASFSLLRSKLCFTKSRITCGVCLQSAKAGRGTSIYTGECSHTFHFTCVVSRSGDRNVLSDCPVCGVSWNRETSILPPLSLSPSPPQKSERNNKALIRVYNDDEPLISSPISPACFNTIPEEEEEDDDDDDDFKGFFVNNNNLLTDSESRHLVVDVKLSSESAIVAAVGRGHETYSFVMTIKSPPARRSPVDLVTVLDVTGNNIETVKRAMRLLISSLRETDRLSMVSFSSTSKRLTPLRRMTANGRRTALRIVDDIAGDGDGMSVNDAVKKAAKVIEDRRQKNRFTTIFVLTDRKSNSTHSDFVYSTRFSSLGIPTHTIWLGACNHGLPEDALAKRIKSLLSLSVQDLTLKLGLVSGSGQGEITSVYSLSGRPMWLGSGFIQLGDMYGHEERQVLVELKSPISSSSSSSSCRSRRILTVRSRHVDATNHEIRNSENRTLLIPSPIAVGSSNPNIARLRNLHVSTRAVAESRRLIEANDYSGSERLLTSARALLIQYGLSSSDACLRGVDAELADLNRLGGRHVAMNRTEQVAQKSEALTPTSAWRVAERLAKVAIMRKHLNKVSDLHGFENARF